MKIYIEDEIKINVFSLPRKIEDEFIIEYVATNGVEETITLIANDNKWCLSSDVGVEIYDGVNYVKTVILTNNHIYKIKYSDLEYNIYLYCFDIPMTYYKLALENKQTITIGSSSDNDITHTLITGEEFKIKISKVQEKWTLDEERFNGSHIFLNYRKYTKSNLMLGDIIFINGLKIIWMDKYISVNNPNNALKTKLTAFQEEKITNTYTPVKDTEKNATLYTEKQVFFHTPRLKKDITEKIIKIENPPQKKMTEESPAILTYGATILTSMSSSITGIMAIFNIATGKATLLGSLTQIIVCISMLATGLMFPIIQDRYKKSKEKKEEKKRQDRYGNYLNKKIQEINNELEEEKSILVKNNYSVVEIENIIKNRSADIWSREIPDDDFLSLRLGLGNRDAAIKIEVSLQEFTMEDDNLRDKIAELKNTKWTLANVPITISMIENNILPIIISDDYKYRRSYIHWLCLQLITYYSGVDLKIAIFTTEENAKDWSFFKYLPHCYNNEYNQRLFSTNEDEYKNSISYLEEQYKTRMRGDNEKNDIVKKTSQGDYKDFDQYYLIITDNYLGLKNYDLIKNIINSNNNKAGFSILILEATMSTIPSRSKCFIEINNKNCTIYNKYNKDQIQVNFKPDFLVNDINTFARVIANIPAISLKQSMSLPTSYNFLEMYKVGKIEQLNISNRWVNNDPVQSLGAPIGIQADGKLLKLDLHEKYHGPHGLIAGATGSGKSEFIITYILSMAINFHPYEVQFVLIDYKGGGLAGAFENRLKGIKIPHLVGTITNLDTNEMNRTLVSINSELKRREHIFNEARDRLGESTVDIYKYQKFYREGRVDKPVSHLFIISDEFAELKAQQPDFMDELVSTARIGRSLGVHLILATQKPSGVVNDQIWSNSRFRICLKVQTAADSSEMLKRPEAAYIKEAGRFYLQVGYDELFIQAQSGWAGAKYIPTERILKSYDDSIDIIDNNGNIIKKINEKSKEDNVKDYGDQVTNTVKYLYDVAKRDNIEFSTLWLPALPAEIYLSNLIKKYNYNAEPYKIVPIIGEYDNPASQEQNILTIDLTNSGNVAIYGIAGSGKENFITTLIYSTIIYHTPDEVNFYIFDFGSETLKVFDKIPHIGDVILSSENEKIKSACLYFGREMSRRKELFSSFGGSYQSYTKNSQKKLPLIIVAINSYDLFRENYPDYDDYLHSLFRDGYKYGLVFIISAFGVNSVSISIQGLFQQKFALKLSEDFHYKYDFDAPFGLVPANDFGRGIVSINGRGYEYQTSLIYYRDKINDIITSLGDKLSKTYNKINKIPVIPITLTSDTLSKYIDTINNVPLGISIQTGNVITHNFNSHKVLQIIGTQLLFNDDFILDLIEILIQINPCKIKVIDFMRKDYQNDSIEYINDKYTDNIKNIVEEDKNETEKKVYLFLGVSKIYDLVLDEGIEMFSRIIYHSDKFQNSYFILLDNYPSYKKLINEPWFSKVNEMSGLFIGNNVSEQTIFDLKNISNTDKNEDFNGLAYYINSGKYEVIKTMGVKR